MRIGHFLAIIFIQFILGLNSIESNKLFHINPKSGVLNFIRYKLFYLIEERVK